MIDRRYFALVQNTHSWNWRWADVYIDVPSANLALTSQQPFVFPPFNPIPVVVAQERLVGNAPDVIVSTNIVVRVPAGAARLAGINPTVRVGR